LIGMIQNEGLEQTTFEPSHGSSQARNIGKNC
jgi:hypothetical protein